MTKRSVRTELVANEAEKREGARENRPDEPRIHAVPPNQPLQYANRTK